MPAATEPLTTAKARRRWNASAVDAWQRARAALAARQFAAARFWLERVCRIAPDDGRPRFELAVLLAALNDPEAPAMLESVASRFNHGDSWLTLALLHRRNRAHDQAAEALATLLHRHEAPASIETGADFASLASEIARAAGRPGWCGIAGGHLAGTLDNVEIEADGVPLPIPPADLAPISRLDIRAAGLPLLGSPLDLAAIRRHEGIAIATAKGGIEGWVSRPAAPETPPHLTLIDRGGTRRTIRPCRRLDPGAEAPLTPRYGFRVAPSALRGLAAPFRIETPDGTALSGTPLDPARLAALEPATARRRHPALPARAPLCAVMPAYRDAEATRAAIVSFHAASAKPCPLIVIDDASPEPDLVAFLDAERDAARIVLIRHSRNRGFPASVNAGIAAARRLVPGCDILLLNADILLPPGAPARLHAALYAAADIASATPLSNEATILSYPSPRGGNPAPGARETARLDALARRVNRGVLVDIPTAIGFCMAIRHDALDATGRFDAAIFAQGYGEENDWSRRAALRGFRHVAVASVFVAHRGGTSFGASGAALRARNLDLLERRHPGYRALIEAHHEVDPLCPARFRLDRARFAARRGRKGAVVLISHDHGGGIARIVGERMKSLRARGIRPILLQPDLLLPDGAIRETGPARLTDGAGDDYPSLTFDPARAMGKLVALLRPQRVRHVEFHHMLGHDPALRQLPARLGVAAEYVVHDYAAFCNRVNLIGPGRRYCGEPDLAGCLACLAEAGSEMTDPIGPTALRARSMAEFCSARRVTVPSADAAARMRRHFPGIRVSIRPWEDDTGIDPPPSPPPGPSRLVAVVGGIGAAKGYDILLDCARDAAARNLPLSFVLVGASEADDALLDAGRVMITGAFPEGEAVSLIRRTGAVLGFLPSIWPETWCFALGELWRAGLNVIGFDLGAQAERIRATGWGAVLPLGLPASRINQALLAWQPDLRDLGISDDTRKLQTVRQAAPLS